MEILKSLNIIDCEYQVLKGFAAHVAGEKKSRALDVGEIVTFSPDTNPRDILGWCNLKRIAVASVPDTGKYRARRDFRFRVGKVEHKIEAGQFVEVKAADDWNLLLNGTLEPVNATGWSPARLMKHVKVG